MTKLSKICRLMLIGVAMCAPVSGQIPLGVGTPSAVMPAGGPQAGYPGGVQQTGAFDQFGADAKMRRTPVKPSQKATPQAAGQATAQPRVIPNAQTSQGRYSPSASANGPVTNPNDIVLEDVPLIPRRAGQPSPFQAATPTTAAQQSPPAGARTARTLSAPIEPVERDLPADGPSTTSSRMQSNSGETWQQRLAAARRAGNSSYNPPAVQNAADNAARSGIKVETTVPGQPTLAAPEYQAESSISSRKLEPNQQLNPYVDDKLEPASVSPKRVFDDGDELPSILNTGTPSSPTAVPAGNTPPVVTGPSARKPFTVTGPSARIADRGVGPMPSIEPAKPLIEPAAAAVGQAVPLFSTKQTPQITVETIGPRTLTVGKEATYEIRVNNHGQVAAQDLTVTVRVPDFAELQGTKVVNGAVETVAPTAAESGVYTLQWTLPRLEGAANETLAVRLTPRKSRPFELGVQWSIMPVASQAVVEVQEPQLALSLTGPGEILYGQTKIFKLNLSNPGTGDAENVTIHLSPLSDPNAPMTKHPIGTLSAGDSKIIEVEMTARQPGKVQIRAKVTADGDLSAQVAEEVHVRRAGLQVAVAAPKSKFTGTSTVVGVSVTNPGDAPAEKVQVTATLPTGAKFLSTGAQGKYQPESNTVVWTLPTLAAGAEQTFEYKCLVWNPGANKFTAQATATGDLAAENTGTMQVEALADLKLEVVEPKGPLPLGEEVTYEVTIRNRGSKSAEQIHVVAFFEEGIDPLSAVGGQHELGNGDVRFAPIASLASGAAVTFKIKAMPKKYGNLAFRAEAVCETDGSKLAQQCTVLYYGDEPAATGAKPIAGPDDDISAAAGQPVRQNGGSSRKPLIQAAPPAGGVAPTLPPTATTPAPATVPTSVVAPALPMTPAAPTTNEALQSTPSAVTAPTAAVESQPKPMPPVSPLYSLPPAATSGAAPAGVPLGGPTTGVTNAPLSLPTPSVPNGPTLLLPSKP